MNILTNSHIFSNLVLSIAGVLVFLKYFKAQTLQSRLLWGIFLLSISINAVVELFVIAGVRQLQTVNIITQAAGTTLGAICLVVASFSLILKYRPSVMVMISTLALGVTLFLSILIYKVPYVGLIIQPFCIIVTLCISCLGLAYRQKSALWVVLAMTLLAVSAKSQSIPLPMHPLDLNHYIVVLAIICVGRAVQDQYKILF
ncbi:hypothetical protein [Dyadobacter frigoris]|uniref:Uncharacterized protein n=1 Tax=Dyadobacter frigoris TaxID=2576211 RepID=A0A4U6D7D9_9BACT|nr:hypothetical protein [Dyadobacter frigoris]TKT92048.1 hypothetical protein FDK13_13000 [Dyadobacter frigoris]GLU53070.1 hypothetical protein Dfri01_25310 [Dyadobacter frigoris]